MSKEDNKTKNNYIPESPSHFVGGHHELVVEIGFAVEESYDGDVESVHVVCDAQLAVLLLRGSTGLLLHVLNDVVLRTSRYGQ